MKLNEKLLSLRKAKGLTQMKLAEMTNVSRQAVSRWESGEAVPAIDNLKFLGQLYGVPLEYLLCEDAPEPAYVETETQTDEIKQNRKNVKKALLFVAVGIIVVVLCAMLFRSKEESIPMENIEGSEMETVGDFEFDW